MQIFHIDRETGVYLGTSQADENPLDPGEFLIPANAVTVAPPAFASGYRARWDGVTWIVEPIPVPAEPPAPTAPTDSELASVALMKTDVVAIRCFKSGVAFPENWKSYVFDLRSIVNGGPGPVPNPPMNGDGTIAYPAGT